MIKAVKYLIIFNISMLLRLMFLLVCLWKQTFLILTISADIKGIRSKQTWPTLNTALTLCSSEISDLLCNWQVIYCSSPEVLTGRQCQFGWFAVQKYKCSNLYLRTDYRKMFFFFWSTSTRISCLVCHPSIFIVQNHLFLFSLSKLCKFSCVILRSKCK